MNLSTVDGWPVLTAKVDSPIQCATMAELYTNGTTIFCYDGLMCKLATSSSLTNVLAGNEILGEACYTAREYQIPNIYGTFNNIHFDFYKNALHLLRT